MILKQPVSEKTCLITSWLLFFIAFVPWEHPLLSPGNTPFVSWEHSLLSCLIFFLLYFHATFCVGKLVTASPTALASVHPRGRHVRCPSYSEVSGSVTEDSGSSQALMLVHPGRWGLSLLALSNTAMGPLVFFFFFSRQHLLGPEKWSSVL